MRTAVLASVVLLTLFWNASAEIAAQPSSQQPAPAHSQRPNLIFMLTDDLGYADVGCYGATKVKTPQIDQLAASGVRFTNFVTAASICSPSRAAFLTGAYPQRAGLYMGINPNRTAHWHLGLNPDEITIAELCQQHGYETHMVGKWHLGTEPEFLPRQQGFDHYYGMPCNHAHSPKFFDDDKEIFAQTPLQRLTELYTDRVTSIIRDHGQSGKPFFLYYAHNYPHTPYRAGAAFKNHSQDGVRGDVIEELDWSVGQLIKALKDTGTLDNTIVIFTSDNGPTANQYAKPFRGTKYVSFEGGHRVPFIFYGPAWIDKPMVCDRQINAMDVFPTLASAMGASLPKDRVYDGVSLLPLMRGEAFSRPEQAPFYYYNCENLQAIRRGAWKLHLPRSKSQIPFWDKNKPFTDLQAPVLYNLDRDEKESHNVAADHPLVVKDLMQHATNVRNELGEFMQRGEQQRPTGSVFPDVSVISHPKDWTSLGQETIDRIDAERQRRHASPKKSKRRKLKAK